MVLMIPWLTCLVNVLLRWSKSVVSSCPNLSKNRFVSFRRLVFLPTNLYFWCTAGVGVSTENPVLNVLMIQWQCVCFCHFLVTFWPLCHRLLETCWPECHEVHLLFTSFSPCRPDGSKLTLGWCLTTFGHFLKLSKSCRRVFELSSSSLLVVVVSSTVGYMTCCWPTYTYLYLPTCLPLMLPWCRCRHSSLFDVIVMFGKLRKHRFLKFVDLFFVCCVCVHSTLTPYCCTMTMSILCVCVDSYVVVLQSLILLWCWCLHSSLFDVMSKHVF
jgi:hypothetical protein